MSELTEARLMARQAAPDSVCVNEMPLADALALIRKQGSKWHNRKVIIPPHEFDSVAEADRFLVLQMAQAAGDITCLEIHPRCELQPGFRTVGGQRIRPIVYEADFRYFEPKTCKWILEDLKGKNARGSTETAMFRLKCKMWLFHQHDLWHELRVIGSDGSVRVVGTTKKAIPRESKAIKTQ